MSDVIRLDGRRRRRRLEWILGQEGQDFSPQSLGRHLEQLFARQLVDLTGDARRDVCRFDAEVDAYNDRAGKPCIAYEIRGFGDAGTCRLWSCFECREESHVVTITVHVVATKGSREASLELFGKRGPDIGNSLMLARLFDLTLEAAVRCGVRYIENTPWQWDPELTSLFVAMGFSRGERDGEPVLLLDLLQENAIDRALSFVEQVYLAEGQRESFCFVHPWRGDDESG